MSNKLWESHITWICYSFIRLPFIWYVIINCRPDKRSLFYDIRLLYKITKRTHCRDPAALWDCKKKIFTKWCQDCEPLLSSGCSLLRKKEHVSSYHKLYTGIRIKPVGLLLWTTSLYQKEVDRERDGQFLLYLYVKLSYDIYVPEISMIKLWTIKHLSIVLWSLSEMICRVKDLYYLW